MSKIAIIGGGIGGLTAGIALQRAGVDVTIYERAAEFGQAGAGISMTPNAVLGLDSLGLGEGLRAAANQPLEQNQHHAHSGELLLSIDRRGTEAKYGAPYLQLHRADLMALLIAAFGPDNCEMGRELTAIHSRSDGVTLSFADGSSASADAVVAADGLRSIVRDALFETGEPIFSGHVAYRGLIPASKVDPRALEPLNINHLASGRNVVSYPVRGGELVNLVALSKAESWVDEGWSVKADQAQLAAIYADFAPYVRDLIAEVPKEQLFRWGLFIREPLGTWRAERTVLLGDAAHPMLPYFGQGASCAIEDGVVLGRAFAETSNLDAALDTYVATRIERASYLQRESNAGGERLQAIDPDTFGKAAPVRNEDVLDIFAYDPATVPLIRA